MNAIFLGWVDYWKFVFKLQIESKLFHFNWGCLFVFLNIIYMFTLTYHAVLGQ